MPAMLRHLFPALFALVLSGATVWIHPATDEKALYALEGSLDQNHLPREVAGWPAPFLADDPGTSVIHKIGVEDVFRPGSFIATWCFWLVVVSAMRRLGRLTRKRVES